MPNKIETPHLITRETAKQILEEDYPKHTWPISGGWGYDESCPCVIELDTENEGVPFETEFILYRSYEELIVFKPRGERYAGINVRLRNQYLIYKDGKQYDKVEYTVTAFTEKDWDMLKEDWESHGGYKDDPDGKRKHIWLRMLKTVSFKTIGYFDISRFFGKGNSSSMLKK